MVTDVVNTKKSHLRLFEMTKTHIPSDSISIYDPSRWNQVTLQAEGIF